MKCDELKSVYIDRAGDWCRSGNDTGKFYLKEEVDAAIEELKAGVKFCSDFELAARKDIEEMRGQHQMLKQFGHYKLSPVQGKMITHEVRQYVSYNVVCMIIKHLESENAELKQKLENVQASMYADVVDANMEVRRLKRALYKALSNWAHFAVAFFSSYATKEKWRKMENKCLKKAEEYK